MKKSKLIVHLIIAVTSMCLMLLAHGALAIMGAMVVGHYVGTGVVYKSKIK